MFSAGSGKNEIFEKLFGLRLREQRQQGIDLTDRSGGEFRHDVFEPMPETDVIGLACGSEGIKDCQPLTAFFGRNISYTINRHLSNFLYPMGWL